MLNGFGEKIHIDFWCKLYIISGESNSILYLLERRKV